MIRYVYCMFYKRMYINRSWCKFPPFIFEAVSDSLSKMIQNTSEIASNLTLSHVASDISKLNDELFARRVHVGFVGLMKVGKSTTLNALLHNRVLPSSVTPETAVEVTIVHNTSHPNGTLAGQLKTNNRIKVITRGNENITKVLQQLNKQKRDTNGVDNQELSKYENISLHIPVPFLTNNTCRMHIDLTISDTPGSDEAVLKSLNLNKIIEHLAAFVVVLDYRRMKTEQEISLLKALRSQHSRLFLTPDRLLFILNHINSYDEHRGEHNNHSISPDQAPQFVANYLKELLKVGIHSSQVIPYSAYWALVSRLGPQHMTDELRKEAYLVLHHLRDSSNLTNIELCRELEKYSQIKVIEDRMVQLFVTFGKKIIEKNVAEKLMHNITALVNVIDDRIDKLQVPEKEKNVSNTKEILDVMPQIEQNATNAFNTTSLLKQSAILANMEHTWMQRAQKLDDFFAEADGAVFNSKETVNSSIRDASSALEQDIVRSVQVLLEGMLKDYLQNMTIELQSYQSLIETKLKYVETIAKYNPLTSSVLKNFSIPDFSCNNSFMDTASIYKYLKAITSTITFKVPAKSTFLHPTHHLICEHDVEEKKEELFTIRVLPLQREMKQYLEQCYKQIKNKLESLTTTTSMNIGRELSDHIQSWWKPKKDSYQAQLTEARSVLKTAKGKCEEMEKTRSLLKQHFQSLEYLHIP